MTDTPSFPSPDPSHREFMSIRVTARRLGIGDQPLRLAVKRGELQLYTFGTSRGLLRWTEVMVWSLASAKDVKTTTTADEWAASRVRAEREQSAA